VARDGWEGSCYGGMDFFPAMRRSFTSSTRCSTAREMVEDHRTIPWRKPIASLNYLLDVAVWRQDHNGFSHQDPGSSTTLQ